MNLSTCVPNPPPKKELGLPTYCEVCGERLIEYTDLKKIRKYDPFSGRPIYYGGYMRCPKNPCHQGHDWEDYGTWWENFKMSWKHMFMFRHIVRCKRCGEKNVRT